MGPVENTQRQVDVPSKPDRSAQGRKRKAHQEAAEVTLSAVPTSDLAGSPLGFDFGVLKRQRRLIAWFVASGLVLLMATALLVPARYTATAQLEVLFPSDPSPARLSFSDPRAAQMALDKHLIMLKSRELLEKVYETSGAKNDPALQPAFWSLSRNNDTAVRIERFAGLIGVNQLLSSAVIAIQYTSSNPELAAAVANTLAKTYVEQSLEWQRSVLTSGLRRIDARLGELYQSLEARKAKSDKQGALGASGDQAQDDGAVQDLRSDELTTRQTIAELTRRQDELRRQFEAVEGEVRIASLAAVPIGPSSLSPLYFLLPGTVLLLAGAIFLAHLRERFDGSIHSPEQVSRILGIPSIANLPDFREVAVEHPATDAAQPPYSAYEEGIRTLAVGLNLVRKSQPPKVVLLSSCESGSGKSTLVFSLAQYLSMIGRRVLVIDLDWRKQRPAPDQHDETGSGVLDLRAAIGTSDLTPRRHPSQSFDYIPTKAGSDDALRFIAGHHLSDPFVSLREKYDVVLIDGPSAEAAAEAWLLAELADQAVLVVKCNSTTEASAGRALAALKPALRRRSGLVAVLTYAPAAAKSGGPARHAAKTSRFASDITGTETLRSLRRWREDQSAKLGSAGARVSRAFKHYFGGSA